ncbi:Rv3235 family protein [Rhodococcoides kroppenstedtii]|uniref:Rv3235 family protein n=1 Tax=Rhodococcoides kroppenstedtii TaxID=293050 RepID=UPI0036284DFA
MTAPDVRLDHPPASEPALDDGGSASPCPCVSTAVGPRISPLRVSGRRPGPHSGRSPDRAASRRGSAPDHAAPRSDPDPELTAARVIADRLLRGAFEVIDRRRAPASLRAGVSPAVLGMIASLSTAEVPGRAAGVAVLRTVHVRRGARGHLEVFGSYSRGERRFAVAAQLSHRTPAGSPWIVTSLRLS